MSGHTNGTSLTTSVPNAALDLPATSRSRVAAAENEEADTVLALGDFDKVPTLSHSETRLLLDAVLESRRNQAGGKRPEETETLTKTMDWLNEFARYKTREAIIEVDRLLSGYQGRLEGFERSQLATLCPSDGDEAFTLIPSLKTKFTQAEMDELTRQIADLRTFE